MTTTNAAGQVFTNNADGFLIGGGATERDLTVTGANIIVTGSGANTYTYPASTSTLAALGLAQTFTALQTFSGGANISPSGSNLPVILSTTPGINAKTVAVTNLYTVPAGKTCTVTSAVIRCTAASAITVGPSLGIQNGAGTNNIFSSSSLTVLTGTTSNFGFSLVGASVSTVAADIVSLNLGTAATGTSQTIEVVLLGYLE